MKKRSAGGAPGSLILYLIVSVLYFGRPLILHSTSAHIGVGEDPALMMWFLAWWPHALANHLNPVITHAIWAPEGFNLTWQTCIPLISLLAAPVTRVFGPLVSLNILCIVFPAIAAWSAYLLCLHLSSSRPASLVGGYLFGFSPYMLGQMTFAHLHTLSIFPIPLIALLALRELEGSITKGKFVAAASALLVVEFLFSIEIFATVAILAAIALLLGALLAEGAKRERIGDLILAAGCAFGVALLAVSPYIYCFFAYHFQHGSIWPVALLSTDLLNLVVPTPTVAIGHLPVFETFSSSFSGGNMAESMGFIAWPLLIPVFAYGYQCRREMGIRFVICALVVAVMFSLGPVLMVAGRSRHFPLPLIFFQVPILNNIAPGRFAIYVYLLLALTTSLWLSYGTSSTVLKIAVVISAAICLIPDMSAEHWVTVDSTPTFFKSGLYRTSVAKGETVTIFPWGLRGESMYWQAQTRMYFQMAQGAGNAPASFELWPITDAFVNQTWVPHAPDQFRAFLYGHDVGTVIVADGDYWRWSGLLASLHTDPVRIGNVRLYRLGSENRGVAEPDALVMRSKFDTERFERLLVATEGYLAGGGSSRDLSPSRLFDTGQLSPDALIGPSDPYPFLRPRGQFTARPRGYEYGVWALGTPGGEIAVGIQAGARPGRILVERFGSLAAQVAPADWLRDRPQPEVEALIMTFSPGHLARAATLAAEALRAEPPDPARATGSSR
jgi:hypothetical protein